MTGESHWFPPLIVLLGGLFIVFGAYWIGRASKFLQRRHMMLTCPVKQTSADCSVVYDTRTNRAVDIVSCSLLEKPNEVHCTKSCLHGSAA